MESLHLGRSVLQEGKRMGLRVGVERELGKLGLDTKEAAEISTC